MTNPIYDIIIEMRTPIPSEEHAEIHRIIYGAKLAGSLTDEILALCTDGECLACGAIVCPYQEPLHFHHDGCPACSQNE